MPKATKQQLAAARAAAYKLKATGPSPTADLEQYVAVIAQAVMENEPFSLDALVAMILDALGHTPKISDRCTAQVVPAKINKPGPNNPPIWCCLKAGHEGAHKCNYGGMVLPAPFRDSDEVEFREPVTLCTKCGTRWPCPDTKAVYAAADLMEGKTD
jgi:hypothetical protein